MLKEQSQSLDNAEIRLGATMQKILVNAKQNFQLTANQINQSGALQKYEKYQDHLNAELQSLKHQIKSTLNKKQFFLENLTTNLKAVSPLAVLDRGYAIVMNEKDQAIKSSKNLKIGDTLNTRLASGSFTSNVSKKD